MGALVTTNVFEPVLGSNVGTVFVSPPNEPLNVYVPPGSDGVMVHVATPDALVVRRARLGPVQLEGDGLSGHGCVGVVVDQRPRHGGGTAVGPGGRAHRQSGGHLGRAHLDGARRTGWLVVVRPGVGGADRVRPERLVDRRNGAADGARGPRRPGASLGGAAGTQRQGDGLVGRGVLPVVRTPDNVTGWPLVVELSPV